MSGGPLNQMEDNVGFDVMDRGSVVRDALRHVAVPPTSAKFDPSAWAQALAKNDLDESTKRILQTGQWLGRRLLALRGAFPGLFDGFEVEDAIDCTIGYANAAYLKNRRNFDKAKKQERMKYGVGTTLLGHITIQIDKTDQIISEDHLVTTIIDSLSHALFYASIADSEAVSIRGKAEETVTAFRVSNIEFIYRATWLQALWEGYYLEAGSSDIFLRPCSEKYGEWWPVWDVRRQNLIAEQLSLMASRIFGHLEEELVPNDFRGLLPSMRVRLANWRDSCWNFRYVKVSRTDKDYRSIVAAAVGIRETSLWPYISKVIPKYARSDLTLGDVLKAWQVIESCAESIAVSVDRKSRKEVHDIRDFALRLPILQLKSVIQICCNFGEEKAQDVIDFLSIDLNDTNFLFNRGVWANPLIPSGDGCAVRLVLPVFTIGNIVRSFENWIEQCDFAKAGEIKGANFEEEVVKEVQKSAYDTELPVRVEVFGPNLHFLGEEIDALIIVGDTLIILECKNFLTPGDSVERAIIYFT